MALNKDAQKKLLKALKYSDADIAKLVDDANDVDVDVPEMHVYDPTGLTELQNNIKKGYEKDYPEIWCRAMNTEHELGLTGAAAKDPKKIIEAMKAKAVKEAGITPGEWENKFKEVQTTVDAKNSEILTVKQQLEALQAEKKYRQLFFADMSDALDDEEWISRLQKTFEIVTDGDVLALKVKATGKIVTDEKMNPLPFKEAFDAEIKKDGYKAWFKAKAPEAAKTDPKKTHDPNAIRNPAIPKVKKYATQEDIMKEVDKAYPKEKQQQTPGFLKLRKDMFNKLRAEAA